MLAYGPSTFIQEYKYISREPRRYAIVSIKDTRKFVCQCNISEEYYEQ